MAVMNPCCCKLDIGASIVAIFNMVCSSFLLLIYLIALLAGAGMTAVAFASQDDKDNDKDSRNAKAALAVLGIFVLVISIMVIGSCIISFVAAVMLLIGAQKKEISKCRFWFAVTVVLLVLYLVLKFTQIGATLWTAGTVKTSVISVVIGKHLFEVVLTVLIEGYQLWVVYAFMDELKREPPRESMYSSEGTVHYVPKPIDNPPLYVQGGPYPPSGAHDGQYLPPYAATQGYSTGVSYPMPPQDEQMLMK